MEPILKYFSSLTERQREQFAALEPLYREWNGHVNVISRRDMASGEFYLHHVLHSLSIARVCTFEAGTRVLDVGTGGGFPAIPLAVLFPQAHFTAVDSIGKKIRVVEEIARAIGLTNLTAMNERAENVSGRFDWVVSRAVAPAAQLLDWVWPKTKQGAIFLKGGDLSAELATTHRPYALYNIADFFAEDFFATKKIVYFRP